ncbi:MAG: solute carrier family 23 protein [Euryarchaeota archaeon]|jgi:uracil permease|uniref:uracil-xanthine permease family protein n=1 Tax=Methanobacterium sp. MZD130B TaxID=3394378 RepID=UPI00176CFCF1|nr:solute carrier family 23 protein [Euryarchaeota archaeon]HHT19576.1 purine/pyrimidine permease [Methanobacterium sp.]
MKFRYGLDDKPKKTEMLVVGLQYFAVILPSIIILGTLVGVLEFGADYIPYLQKLLLIIGIFMIIQIYLGHRLPLVIGPVTVILIAILTSFNQGVGGINSSILIGGILVSILVASGLFRHVKKLFTPRVVTVILILLTFTLIPTIISLISVENHVPSSYNVIFAIVLLFIIFIGNTFLKGIWRSALTFLALFGGSALYFIIFGNFSPNLNLPLLSIPSGSFIGHLAVPNISVFITFLISFLALVIIDLGIIQSAGIILDADEMETRVEKGIFFTGLGNVLAGLLGVIGIVNYNLSIGIISTTKNASKFAVIPAAIIFLVLAFSPIAIGLISNIPSPVLGIVLLYVLIMLIGPALLISIESNSIKNVDDGAIIGLPILLGTIIAFLPQSVITQFPQVLQPLVANGYVIGTIAVFLLEHVLYPRHSVYNEKKMKQ